jgi:hypothetical protein
VSGCTLVTQDKFKDDSTRRLERIASPLSYYSLLELSSTATLDEVRRAYRQKSKLYHPDTTLLPAEVAVQKFRELNEAYAVLSNPEQRQWYDAQPEPLSHEVMARSPYRPDFRDATTPTAALDPKERTLSPGEILALLILGATFLVCLVLAIILGVARGEMVIQNTHLEWPVHRNHASPIQPHPSSLVAPSKPTVKSSTPDQPQHKPQRKTIG